MANKTEYDYTDIEQPYNDDLQRGDDSLSSEVKASTEEAGNSIIESPSDVGGNVMNGSQLSNVWLNTWMKSRGYKPKTQGFLIDGAKGYIECMKLYVGSGGIIGGSLDIPDTTSANSWHVDSSGNMWIGAAAFASAPFKALSTGAVTCTDLTVTGTSTIGGRLAATIGGAIDISGDLINDVVNARINTDSKNILSDFNFGSTNYAGAVKAGDIMWNTTTGAITGGSGVVVYRNGIVGAKAGVVTFTINTSGDATFTGIVTATAGSIGSFSIGTYLYSGSKTAWNDANAGVHIGSDGIGVGNNVFTVNGATGAVTCSNLTITGGSVQWSIVAGTGKPADNATVGATFGVNVSGGSSGTNYVGNNGYITTITGSSITTGTLNASLCNVTNISASNINTGTLNASIVTVSNINASNISTGTLSADRISSGSLGASKMDSTIISGGKIITSLLTASNITTGTLNASVVSVTNLSATNITTGTLSVGGTSQPAKIVINRNGSDGFLTWSGGNKIWSDGSEYMGFSADGGRFYFYRGVSGTETNLVALIEYGSQASFYSGINCEGNFNVDSAYAARFEGIPVYFSGSGYNKQYIHATTDDMRYYADTNHEFYQDTTIKAIIDANIWTAGNLYADGTKPFIMKHPDGSDRYLRYTAQESPDVCLRYRGKGIIDYNGEKEIVFPSHFVLVTEKNDLVSIILTPTISSQNLFVKKQTSNESFIASGTPSSTFFFEVIATRKGYSGYQSELDEKDSKISENDKIFINKLKHYGKQKKD